MNSVAFHAQGRISTLPPERGCVADQPQRGCQPEGLPSRLSTLSCERGCGWLLAQPRSATGTFGGAVSRCAPCAVSCPSLSWGTEASVLSVCSCSTLSALLSTISYSFTAPKSNEGGADQLTAIVVEVEKGATSATSLIINH